MEHPGQKSKHPTVTLLIVMSKMKKTQKNNNLRLPTKYSSHASYGAFNKQQIRAADFRQLLFVVIQKYKLVLEEPVLAFPLQLALCLPVL
jgi:hypothetical protein